MTQMYGSVAEHKCKMTHRAWTESRGLRVMLLSVSLALERKTGPETVCTIPPYGISLAHIAIFLLNIVAWSGVSTYLDGVIIFGKLAVPRIVVKLFCSVIIRTTLTFTDYLIINYCKILR